MTGDKQNQTHGNFFKKCRDIWLYLTSYHGLGTAQACGRSHMQCSIFVPQLHKQHVRRRISKFKWHWKSIKVVSTALYIYICLPNTSFLCGWSFVWKVVVGHGRPRERCSPSMYSDAPSLAVRESGISWEKKQQVLEVLLLMDEILHHLGWLKPYK